MSDLIHESTTFTPYARILVTGAGGFIGCTVVKTLRRQGYPLRLVVRSPKDIQNLSSIGLSPDESLEFVVQDLTQRFALPRILEGCDGIIHAAGRMASGRDARRVITADNVEASAYLLEAALKQGVRRFLYISHVFGVGCTGNTTPADESVVFDLNDFPGDFLQAKRIAELEALRAATRGLSVVFPTPTFCVGPGALRRSDLWWIPALLHPLGRFWVGGVNLVDVRDVASAIVDLLHIGDPGERFFLGGTNLSFADLRRKLLAYEGGEGMHGRLHSAFNRQSSPRVGRLLGRVVQRFPVSGGSRAALAAFSSRYWYYDDRKARAKLGYSSRSLEETLKEAELGV